jgi:hypothetical protein
MARCFHKNLEENGSKIRCATSTTDIHTTTGGLIFTRSCCYKKIQYKGVTQPETL